MGDTYFNIYHKSDHYFENTLTGDKLLTSVVNSNKSDQLIRK